MSTMTTTAGRGIKELLSALFDGGNAKVFSAGLGLFLITQSASLIRSSVSSIITYLFFIIFILMEY